MPHSNPVTPPRHSLLKSPISSAPNTPVRHSLVPPTPTKGERIQTYSTCLLLGLSGMLAWNAILNALSFFSATLEDDKISNKITSVSMVSQIPLSFLLVLYGGRFSHTVKIVPPFVIQAFLLLALPLLASGTGSTLMTLSLIFLNSVCISVVGISIFGFVSLLPSYYIVAIVTGQGVAGVLASVVHILIKGLGGNESRLSTVSYFGFSSGVLILTSLLYLRMLKLPEVAWHLVSKDPTETTKTGQLKERQSSVNGTTVPFLAEKLEDLLAFNEEKEEKERQTASDMEQALLEGGGEGGGAGVGGGGGGGGVYESSTGGEHRKQELFPMKTFKVVWPLCFCVASVFICTFLVFPATQTEIYWKGSNFDVPVFVRENPSWWNSILMLVFNLFDTFGRFGPSYFKCVSERFLPFAVFIRFACVPLYIACAHHWDDKIFTDEFACSLVAVFAFTNGYLTSLAFIYGPRDVKQEDKVNAGFLLSFFLNFGIFAGSQLAWLIK